jgi:hypothetical protein
MRLLIAISGKESVLAFVKEQGKPTSQEIERQWKAEGRKGGAAKSRGHDSRQTRHYTPRRLVYAADPCERQRTMDH